MVLTENTPVRPKKASDTASVAESYVETTSLGTFYDSRQGSADLDVKRLQKRCPKSIRTKGSECKGSVVRATQIKVLAVRRRTM